jgi:hypothetical protein
MQTPERSRRIHHQPTLLRTALPWLAVLLLIVTGAVPARAAPPAQASIAVLKIASQGEVRPGESYSYSIAIIRDSSTAAVTVRDELDPNLVLVDTTGSQGVTCQPGQPLVCTLEAGNLPVGTIVLQVYARPNTPPGTVIRNQAGATNGSETVESQVVSVRISGTPATPYPTRTATPIPTWTPLPTRTPGPTATAPPPGTPVPTATAGSAPPQPTAATLDCDPQPLVRLPGVRAPEPRLNALAAASFAQVRQEIIARTGQDVLAVLADVLRSPGFTTNKPGVAHRSWHKTGRAIDLNLAGPFTLRREGSYFRVFVGSVDITAIFEAHGWQRIPAQGSVLEWWHYEYHPDGIAWQSAMAQVWPQGVLEDAFPEIDWDAVGCTTGSFPPGGDGIVLDLPPGACIPDPPIWEDAPGVSYSRGCGPPVLPPSIGNESGTLMRQFVGTVGWLGQTGRLVPPGSAGVHLHLGLDIGVTSDMCRWPLQAPGVSEGQPPPGASWCETTWADPLQFLPQANPDTLVLANGTPVPVASGPGDPTLSEALVQLPPPGHPAATLLDPSDPDRPDGTWWSPGNDDRANAVPGALGGPAILDWLAWLWCFLFGWLPWAGCGP